MSDSFDEVYLDTRRQLRGVAESLIAGPQYRASGTIRLAVRPDGFAGPAQWIHRSHYAGGHAIKPVPLEAHRPVGTRHSACCARSTPHMMSTHSRSHIAEFFQRGRREL